MNITSIEAKKINDFEKSKWSNIEWGVTFDSNQTLSIKFKATDPNLVNQTVLQSDRKTTFANGAQVTVTPRPPIPCLDGGVANGKWYETQSHSLINTIDPKTTYEVKLDDAPEPRVPKSARSKETNERSDFASFETIERFRVSLCVLNKAQTEVEKLFKQWEWELRYKLVRDGEGDKLEKEYFEAKWIDIDGDDRREVQLEGDSATIGCDYQFDAGHSEWVSSIEEGIGGMMGRKVYSIGD